ncbi:MAG: GNAT family N-acetyltransferase [Blastocatellia bacterium]|nr:GNAT family N-acetyltransferase [Blastocatellia bacterium]
MNATELSGYPFSDLALSRRLERTEGQSNVDFVATRAELMPETGACWIEAGGAYAMFDGPTSPLTQTFGLGLFEELTPVTLDTIEAFFLERGAPVFHEISAIAATPMLPMLNERGYLPIELTSVMFRPIHRGIQLSAQLNDQIQVRMVETEEDQQIWAQTSARGWSELPELSDFILEISRISVKRPNTASFTAELDGRPIATGALNLCDGVALLAGASTIPEGRRQGAQLALLDQRLRHAAEQGCDLAMMCALPGSASQRNAERQGFRIAYTRIKWQLMSPAV